MHALIGSNHPGRALGADDVVESRLVVLGVHDGAGHVALGATVLLVLEGGLEQVAQLREEPRSLRQLVEHLKDRNRFPVQSGFY